MAVTARYSWDLLLLSPSHARRVQQGQTQRGRAPSPWSARLSAFHKHTDVITSSCRKTCLGNCCAQVEVKWCLRSEGHLRMDLGIVCFSPGRHNFVKNCITYKCCLFCGLARCEELCHPQLVPLCHPGTVMFWATVAALFCNSRSAAWVSLVFVVLPLSQEKTLGCSGGLSSEGCGLYKPMSGWSLGQCLFVNGTFTNNDVKGLPGCVSCLRTLLERGSFMHVKGP